MRVLILAEECNPDWPSGPVVVYKAARAIARYAEVVLVTQVRNGSNIERVGMGGTQVVYIDTERIAAPLWKLSVALRRDPREGWLLSDILSYPSHVAFEWLAARRFRHALRRGEFDLVHRLSPISGLPPSFMASACPVPFLLGPISTGLPWPDGSAEIEARERSRTERIGAACLPLVRRLPYMRAKYLRATGILPCFDYAIAHVPESARSKTLVFPNVGIDPDLFPLPSRTPQRRKTVLFAGRLVPYKVPEVVVRAFAASEILRQHRLLIVGDGPERARLEALITENGLAGSVELRGWESQTEVGRLMGQSDIFAFPSVHEPGGGVVLEAMACGLACVVVDHGGPRTLIGPERGVKVPAGDVSQLTASFRDALEGLVAQSARITELGLAAHRHAMTYYTWDAKARKMLEVYEWVTGRQEHKPDFWDQPAMRAAGGS